MKASSNKSNSAPEFTPGSARGLAAMALPVAAIFWGPGLLFGDPQSQLPLLGYMPMEMSKGIGQPPVWMLLPLGVFAVLLLLAWFTRVKAFAIYALLMPPLGLGLFVLRFCAGMGAFR